MHENVQACCYLDVLHENQIENKNFIVFRFNNFLMVTIA